MKAKKWKNLAPRLVRQRLIIEGITDHLVKPAEFKDYLVKLSRVLKMRPLQKPFAYPAEDMGYGGWIHWITSGAHIYSYPKECTGTGHLLTIDTYTCKPFSIKRAVSFTKKYFKMKEVVFKEPI
ncbi:MAG TPA: S-adenosylmethionine decarboxylase [Candidatus Paceibacterota bacterium]|nr:S-adenosylmethionine decarboxylase [Candidatus Paceibacterota bacterium]